LPPLGRNGDESTGRGAGRSAVVCSHDPQARTVEVKARAIRFCFDRFEVRTGRLLNSGLPRSSASMGVVSVVVCWRFDANAWNICIGP
jgi:hypothetical protein